MTASYQPMAVPTPVAKPFLAVCVYNGPERARVRVWGELDRDTADSLRQDLTAALTAARTGIDLDLSGLTFCDVAGLHTLLDFAALTARTGRTLVLAAPGRRLVRLLDLTGTRHLFSITSTPSPPPTGHRAKTPAPERAVPGRSGC